jgi:tripartite ATP-independent transporter DctM subunit
MATAVTMGTVALPEMKKYKYDQGLAAGVVAAGGTMGAMIPPSFGLVFYGIVTESSISKLFFAGFVPGVLEAVLYIATIFVLCTVNPNMGPPGPKTSLTEKLKSLKNTWIVLVLFMLIMGGIYFGVFSPTEAGGVGAFGALLFAVGRRRLGWRDFWKSLGDTISLGAMIVIILIGANILNSFLTVSRLPIELGSFIVDLQVNRYIILVTILLFYLILGCLMDPISMILLTMPIFFPLVMVLGFNPIWFGIIVTGMGEIGVITPPVGLNVFMIKGIAPDIPVHTIFRGIIPFVITDIFRMALIVAFPAIALFLPGLMK